MYDQEPTVRSRELGLALLRAIGTAGLNQSDLATMLAWSPSKVSRMISGKRCASTEDVAAVLAVGGIVGPKRQELLDMARHATERGWWQDCVLGPIELVEYRIREKASGAEVARARVWEMDTFAHTWGEHAVGLIDLEVPPERRRQGFAKFLLTRIILHLQEQFFSLIEAQTPPDNAAMVGLLQGLGFQQTDVGHTYRRTEEKA